MPLPLSAALSVPNTKLTYNEPTIKEMSDQLKTAERLIHDSERLVSCQTRVIVELLRDGRPVADAQRLLKTSERTLARLREHLEYLKQKKRASAAIQEGDRSSWSISSASASVSSS